MSDSNHRAMSARAGGAGFAMSRRGARSWWSQSGSNRRPSGCKPDALPAELWPLPDKNRPNTGVLLAICRSLWSAIWWVWEELHLRPHPYQGCALTN
jgi:hypothetical protein